MASELTLPDQPSRKRLMVVSGLFVLLVLFNLALALHMGSESRANQELESERQQQIDVILKEAQRTRAEAGKLLDQAEQIAAELAPKEAGIGQENLPIEKPEPENQPAVNPQ